MLQKILQGFGLNETEIQTYNLLLEKGPQTAGNLAKTLGHPSSSVYGFLNVLVQKGLIIESQHKKIKLFAPEPPEKINLLFTRKLEQLENAQKEFRQILPSLKDKKGVLGLSPKFLVFQGREQMQQILKDMLLYYDLHTEAFWQISDMLEVLTPDFFRYLNKIRIRNNLYTRAIWPKNKVVELKQHPYLGTGKDFKREIRIAPVGVEASMGYWIYGSRVAFISSNNEGFGMIVESSELCSMLRAQFEILWKISAPLKSNPEEAKVFIQELKKYS